MTKHDVYAVSPKTLNRIWLGRHLESTVMDFISRNCMNGYVIELKLAEEPTGD